MSIVHEILAFIRIVHQVVEFVRPLRVAVNKLPFPRPDHSGWAVFVVNHHGFAAGVFPAEQRGQETPSRQIPSLRKRQVQVIQKRRHKVIRAHHRGLYEPFRNSSRMAHHGRNLDGILVHVQGTRAVPFAPESVVPAAEPVIAYEDDQCLFPNAVRLQPVQNPSHVGVHCRHGGEISLQHFPVAQALIRQSDGPRMPGFLRTGLERAIVVGIHHLPRMPRPRTVRRGVVHAQVERIIVVLMPVYERQRVVRNHVGHISWRRNQPAVPHHRRIVVLSAALLVHKPVLEPMLRNPAIAQMPLAADPARPSVFRQHIRVCHLSRQVRSRIRPHVSISDPIVDAML